MQSVVFHLPGVNSIRDFICKGLGDLPGVDSVLWLGNADSCEEDIGAGLSRIYCVEKGSRSFGELRITLQEFDLYSPYEPYVKNLLNMVSVVLAEREERREREELQRGLEQLVEARTADLEREIKERKKTEAALRNSSAHFQAIYENAEASIRDEDLSSLFTILQGLRQKGVKDLKDYLSSHPDQAQEIIHSVKMLDVNEYSLHLFAASTKEECLERYHETLVEETKSTFLHLLLALWENRDFFRGETVFRRLNGELFPALLSLRIPKTLEEAKQVPVIIMDYSEQKQAQERLQIYGEAIEQNPIAIAITNPEGELEFANSQFYLMTGYPKQEILGKNLSILKSGLTKKEMYEQLWRTIQAGRVWQGLFRNKKKDGELYWDQTTIASIKNKKNIITHYIAIKENISRRLADEEEKRRLEELVHQNRKLEAVGQLAGGIAHDFNNILAGILGSTQLLLLGMDEGDRNNRENVELIQRAAKRASDLTKKLLMFSRKSTRDFEDTDVHFILADTLEIVNKIIPKAITVSLHMRAESSFTHCYASDLQNVFINLMINSAQAIDGKGDIRIKTYNQVLGEEHPLRRTFKIDPGDYLVLEFSDTGKGIPPENIDRIFEPFFTTKKEGQGTGLGLASVFGVLKDHKGAVEVQSTLGEGTLFRLFLPSTSTGEVTSLELAPWEGQAAGILVIDDEELIRSTQSNILKEKGLQVFTASDGEEGILSYQDHKADIDLVILDLNMPEMNGFETAKALKEVNPKIPIIVITGYLHDQDNERLYRLGVQHVLRKPFEQTALLHLIQEILNSKQKG
jgi:two-component system cell cycle sensor histidine kinase/response regulator CckA